MTHSKMPKELLPVIEDGNYSLVIFDKNVEDVKEWLKEDLRTSQDAINDLKKDIRKFEEFDTFSIGQINQIKYRN